MVGEGCERSRHGSIVYGRWPVDKMGPGGQGVKSSGFKWRNSLSCHGVIACRRSMVGVDPDGVPSPPHRNRPARSASHGPTRCSGVRGRERGRVRQTSGADFAVVSGSSLSSTSPLSEGDCSRRQSYMTSSSPARGIRTRSPRAPPSCAHQRPLRDRAKSAHRQRILELDASMRNIFWYA